MRRFVVASIAPVALFTALASLALAVLESRADFEASSRIRDIAGHREAHLAATATDAILDTLAARGLRQGYAVADLDRDDARILLEKPADVGEAAIVRTPPDGTERVRLRFEIVRPEKSKSGVTAVGAIVMVANPGSSGELTADLGKRDPYRDQLKTWLAGLQATFGK